MREFFFKKTWTRICDSESEVGFVRAKNPKDAIVQVQLGHNADPLAYHGWLDCIEIWSSADAYHKKEQPLAIWPETSR